MKIRRFHFLASNLLALILALTPWQLAKAWTSVGTWSSNTQYYKFDSTIPTSYRTYISNGANVWTDVTPSHWSWNLSTTKGSWQYYNNIDGPDFTLALTTYTFLFGHIFSTYTTFDNSENWYAGTGVPGSNQYDLQSAAAHEFGHGLGLDHTSGIYCPGNTNNATMCNPYPKGAYYARTLEGDDRNGVNTLYP